MADQIEILIKTTAELAGAKAAADSLERQIGQAKALGKEYKDMEAQMARARATIAQYENAQGSGGLFASLKNMSWGSITAGIAGAGTAIKLLKDSVGEFAKEEVVLVKLDTALKNAGQSTSEYKERLSELATEMSKATATDDESWLAVFTKLTQFGADSSNIAASAEAVKNLSGLLGGDLQTSAMLVSKALQGNFTMFGRYGIIVKDAGTQTEKLNELFKILAERGGGQMEAMAETLTGKWSGLKVAFDDSLKAVGRFIGNSGALQKSLELLTFVFNGLEDAIGKPMRKLPELSDLAGKQAGAFIDAAGGAEVYAKQVKKLGDEASFAEKALKALKDGQKKDQSFAQTYEDKQKENELARVDLMVSKGQISDLSGTAMKAGINLKYGKMTFDREQAAAKATANELGPKVKEAAMTPAFEEQEKARLSDLAKIATRVREARAASSNGFAAAAELGDANDVMLRFQNETRGMTEKQREDLWTGHAMTDDKYTINTPGGSRIMQYKDAKTAAADQLQMIKNAQTLNRKANDFEGQLGGKTADEILSEKARFDALSPERIKQAQETMARLQPELNDANRTLKEGPMLYHAGLATAGINLQKDVAGIEGKMSGGKGNVSISVEEYKALQTAAASGYSVRDTLSAIARGNEATIKDMETFKREQGVVKAQMRNGGGNR